MFESLLSFLNPIWPILVLAWPILVGWLALKLFPASLIRFVGKEIDRRSDTKLEQTKAELHASYSTLKTSVDVLSLSNSSMHPHIIEAVVALWSEILTMREKSGQFLLFDSIITTEERQEAFRHGNDVNALEMVRWFEAADNVDKFTSEIVDNSSEKHRLFCGDRLWLLFYVYRAIIGRSALLISWSFRDNAYHDWREDDGIDQLFGNITTNEEWKRLKDTPLGGQTMALSRIEGEFLHEATRVMSGTKAMADSLANMQALMLLENARLRGRGSTL